MRNDVGKWPRGYGARLGIIASGKRNLAACSIFSNEITQSDVVAAAAYVATAEQGCTC